MLSIITDLLKVNNVDSVELTPDQRIEFKKDDVFGTIAVVEFKDDPKWFKFECGGEKTLAQYPTPTSKGFATNFLNTMKNNQCFVFGHNKVPNRKGHFKQNYRATHEGVPVIITCDLFVGNDADSFVKHSE